MIPVSRYNRLSAVYSVLIKNFKKLYFVHPYGRSNLNNQVNWFYSIGVAGVLTSILVEPVAVVFVFFNVIAELPVIRATKE